jgi:hypothetical protein
MANPVLQSLPSLGGNTLLIFVFGLVGLVALAIAGGFWAWMRTYNITVDVVEIRGSNTIEYTTRAGIQEGEGGKKLEIWRENTNPMNRIEGPVPDNKDYRMTEDGKTKLRVLKTGVDTFKIIPPANDQDIDQMITKDLEWLDWGTQTLRSIAPRFRNQDNWLRENAGLVGLGLVVVMLMFLGVFGINKYADIGNDFAKVSDNIAEAEKERAKVVSVLYDEAEGQTLQDLAEPNSTNTGGGGG